MLFTFQWSFKMICTTDNYWRVFIAGVANMSCKGLCIQDGTTGVFCINGWHYLCWMVLLKGSMVLTENSHARFTVFQVMPELLCIHQTEEPRLLFIILNQRDSIFNHAAPALTVCSSDGKLLDRILQDRVYLHLKENGLIMNSLHCVFHGRSCHTKLI